MKRLCFNFIRVSFYLEKLYKNLFQVGDMNGDFDHTEQGIYLLIGSPIAKSQSDIKHNKVMQALGLNARYAKVEMGELELDGVFRNCWDGLSVTMPLKEKVIPFLDWVSPEALEIGAVNTVVNKDGVLLGYNTDGIGALNAIEAKRVVRGQRVVIIGAGGAAAAIAYEARNRGAEVFIFNRTKARGDDLARRLGIQSDLLGALQGFSYDILINTTPSELPVPGDCIREGSLVMDIKSIPVQTELLKIAKSKHCTLVFGYEMWTNQAIEQYKWWFGNSLDFILMRDVLSSFHVEGK